IVFAGQGNKDHMRAFIQIRSGRVPRRVLHTALGWRHIGDGWGYLHAGGAIGPDGPIPGVAVELPDALGRFRLPDPPVGELLRRAVRASLGLDRPDLTPDAVTFPLRALVYRAVLPGADFAGHVVGPTGAFKTELAALAQQHYGAAMQAKNLPASWSL